jgi:hypothetical protein
VGVKVSDRFGTLGKPCFRAVRCREAVGVQDFEAVSSSSSSVGVMQVEDTRRVTQGIFVIIDDS